MAYLTGKEILLIGTELWGQVFVSKHHYAVHLSKSNEVWYLNPVNIPWSWKHLFRLPVEVTETEHPGLRVVTYGNMLPRLNRLPRLLQAWAFRVTGSRLRRRLGFRSAPVVWNFDMGRFFNADVFKPQLRIFHLVELLEHPAFTEMYRYRHEACRNADIVLCVADKIAEQARRVVPESKVHFVNHGADLANFENALHTPPVGLPGTNTVKAAFVGNFQRSFNFALLERLAERHAAIDFIMIGPVAGSNLGQLDKQVVEGIRRLRDKPNVYFTGHVPSADIMRYLLKTDINLILYEMQYADGHCNPHKMMAYFFAGKVIISSLIDQYRNNPELVSMGRSDEEIAALFDRAAGNLAAHNSAGAMQVRRQFAAANGYQAQLEKIERIIETHSSF